MRDQRPQAKEQLPIVAALRSNEIGVLVANVLMSETKEERTHTTTTHTLPMARASAGAHGLTTEDGARSTQTEQVQGRKVFGCE